MPKPLRWLDPKDGGVHRFDIVGEKLVPLIDAYEVARLNRNPVPVELLERVIQSCHPKLGDELRALLGNNKGA